jgi:DNA-binding CsgD family transcriptional regulator
VFLKQEMGEVRRELGTAAWVCDPRGNVAFLNARARQLFGSGAPTHEPLPCHRLVRGTDAAGKQICKPNCEVLECAQSGGTLEPLLLQSGGPQGRWIQILSIPLTPPDASARWLVHCACDADRAQRVEGYLTKVAGRSTPAAASEEGRRGLLALSPRERQILAMLAADQDQKEIARKLFLSYATVRNHVQHILVGLGVHSIPEAVARQLLAEAASWGAVGVERKPAERD